MAGTAFKTHPQDLHELMKDCHQGRLQLPDFQRSWVWDEERIRALIASISRAFPIGALMTLETGGNIEFKPRPVEGAPKEANGAKPHSLLLDGQQRMTSLYQVAFRGEVVHTVTPRGKQVARWFYIDIRKAMDATIDREEAIVSIPPNKIVATDFGRVELLNLSSRQHEFDQLMFPVSSIFRWDDWQQGFIAYNQTKPDLGVRLSFLGLFKQTVLDNFIKYQVPLIALDAGTSKEAVCTVFEKVNTGGKALDAFELVTALYAADGHELRRDWFGKEGQPGRQHRLAITMRPAGQEVGIVAGVSNTDFLQAISLFHTRDRRIEVANQGREPPSISANRAALLNLPLTAYLKYQDKVEEGFVQAAKFLHTLRVFRIFDLPYQSQIVPLAAILAEVGDAWSHEVNRVKLAQWYWSGVFGELYGSTVETRIARDFMEVPLWLKGGETPSTVRDGRFRADRLDTMRMRLSAAYKGVNALLMKEGARDFRSGQQFDHAVFFGENVDIHHIFPKKWCQDRGIKPAVYDSIINKTPLSYTTNRVIGGAAPSAYLDRLQVGGVETPPIDQSKLDGFLQTHLIDPGPLRADDFDAFMRMRKQALFKLIKEATGQVEDGVPGVFEEEGEGEELVEAGLTLAKQGGD